MFAAKSKVGLDDLLLKAYKLHTAGGVEGKEAEELMQQVSVALLEFDKQVFKQFLMICFRPYFEVIGHLKFLSEIWRGYA